MIAVRPLAPRLLVLPGIVGGWLLLALAWTPATLLVEQAGGHDADGSGIFLRMLAGFVPWMAATPLLLRLASRYPVGRRRLGPLLVHASAGLVLIPAIAVAGRVLSLLVTPGAYWGNFGTATAIVALYSVPIYVAVAAIGQALVRARPQQPEPENEAYPRRLAVREKGRTELIETRAIDHVEVAGHYLCIHAGGTVHIARGRLGALERQLDPSEFARVHRSAIVRLDRIRALHERRNGDCELLLAGGRRVAASRAYRAQLEARLGVAEVELPS